MADDSRGYSGGVRDRDGAYHQGIVWGWLRAHYTMDVFTGLVAALWVATVCDAVAPSIDAFARRLLGPRQLEH